VLRLKILQRLVRLGVTEFAVAASVSVYAADGGVMTFRVSGAPQRLRATARSSGRERHIAIQPSVNPRWRWGAFTSDTLAPVANNVVIGPSIIKKRLGGVILVLALAARSAEVAFLGFAATAYTRRIVGVVDGAEVAADFAPTTWYTCLIHAFVLGLRRVLRRRRGRTGRVGEV
jgi:hypothetical protein